MTCQPCNSLTPSHEIDYRLSFKNLLSKENIHCCHIEKEALSFLETAETLYMVMVLNAEVSRLTLRFEKSGRNESIRSLFIPREVFFSTYYNFFMLVRDSGSAYSVHYSKETLYIVVV